MYIVDLQKVFKNQTHMIQPSFLYVTYLFVSQSSKKQLIVAFSIVEAKYIATTSCTTQTVCLRRIIEVIYQKQNTPTEIFCNNKFKISMSKNLDFDGRSKYIDKPIFCTLILYLF
ncbi:hypothetical protein CR513_20243, partial [Mucuna pruriens]